MKISKSPKGKAMWAKVVMPDTKFDPDGVYEINLVVDEDDPEIKEWCADLEKMVEEKVQEELEANPSRFKKMPDERPLTTLPVKDVEDMDGNETGELSFKFKLKAVGKNRKGETYSRRPLVVDAKGNPIVKLASDGSVLNSDFKIGNGSTVRCHYVPMPYYMASTRTCGVSLQLKAVQVVKLVEYGNSGYDFDEEDGYEYKGEEEARPQASTSTKGEEGGDENWDF